MYGMLTRLLAPAQVQEMEDPSTIPELAAFTILQDDPNFERHGARLPHCSG